MKAQDLWMGSDYAYGYRGRGAPLPPDAERVKVVEIVKEPISTFNARERTYVRIIRLNDDGMPNPKYNGQEKVRGRDILEFWDEYINTVGEEREAYFERKRQREIQREHDRKVREERSAVYYVGHFLRESWRKHEVKLRQEKERIELEKKAKRLTRVKNVMITRGFDTDKFWLLENQVSIRIEEMERWLGIATEENQ